MRLNEQNKENDNRDEQIETTHVIRLFYLEEHFDWNDNILIFCVILQQKSYKK